MFRLPHRRWYRRTASLQQDKSSRAAKNSSNPNWHRLALDGQAPGRKNPDIQTKLAIGAKNDHYEQEADRIAEHVVGISDTAAEKMSRSNIRKINGQQPVGTVRTPAAQRQPLEAEEEMLQAQPLEEEEPAVQRQALPEEEETVQAKREAGGQGEKRGIPHSLVDSIQGRGQGLPESERAYFEPRLGANLDHVRIHTDAAAARAARQTRAHAFTYGRDIVFGRGEYEPGSRPGRKLLAHELVHTFQQGAGRHAATTPGLSHRTPGNQIQGDFWGSFGRGWEMYWGMDDEGASFARQLMEWRLTGFGLDFVRYDTEWCRFMGNRPEIQRAMAEKFEVLVQSLASAGVGSGSFSTSVTGVRLNELESMRLTLHGCHRIDVEGDYEVTEAGGEKIVRLTRVHFTWIDRADLHPGTETELESGESVDDREFTSAGWDYDIRIHFYMPRSSTWRVSSTGARHVRGWPPVTGAPAAGFRG